MNSCHSSMQSTIDMAPSHGSESNKNGKEFKLNPRAKLFYPSVANNMSATPAAPVSYISNNTPVLHVPVAQPEVVFSPLYLVHLGLPPSLSQMTTQYLGLVATLLNFPNLYALFGQMVGHVGTRTQPLRYVGQYPFQAAPTFGPPNSPAVMVGRLGQLVYMQPLSHDLAQGTTIISPIPPCPLLTTQPVQYPKHQGTAATQALQLCVPEPFMASGHQPLAAAPKVIPALQPSFPLNHPMQLPEANSFFNAKF
ncbi:uncharacterized protein LOC111483301 isoform X1 [Cucurbita maxima]|uniref:Uncharacterized protein LOC111483301 isoform X1 n=1 Tax=Cucurbita maxima TaxID=3661 RepID=A0A6J1JD44_CUCMA|nr:uncharacterized protein LOC111483301 isoform X1 [Cucurbita maxima]XP_022985254.1 uncharacterized protein LOC111483301 isoform X1 [Cucurbita maxima]XP_022985255.1 uncharacterized protein LOC111483301 isoform X1 [Cucurbita maxima]XP_022985256.1 uncharacterized protein LOC111483301 isoform X1 [Cucurbita maxima]